WIRKITHDGSQTEIANWIAISGSPTVGGDRAAYSGEEGISSYCCLVITRLSPATPDFKVINEVCIEKRLAAYSPGAGGGIEIAPSEFPVKAIASVPSVGEIEVIF